MSTPFYDLASLVVVPSGYKASKVYAQKPLTTDGQLTFSRASTATRVNASGLIETVSSNVPRLDYLGSTCPKLLLEPQRTNHVRKNNILGDWTILRPGDIISTAAGISPDGTNNAIKLVSGTTNTGHLFYDSLTSQPTGGNFVMTCYAKADGFTKFGLRESQQIGYYATFNLSTGTVVEAGANVTASIQSMGNGWYRCIANVVGSINACIGLVPLPSGYTTGDPLSYSYAGNGTDGVLVYQPQLEVSATYATSPISTAGVASATRLADACSKTGISSLIGQTEGTIFVDFVMSNNATDMVPFDIAGSDGKLIWIRNAGAQFYGNGTTLIASIETSAKTQGTRYKVAFVYGQNDFRLYRNGSLIGTDTSGTFTGTFSDIALNSVVNQANLFNQVLIFKTKLTNAQLAELTTL